MKKRENNRKLCPKCGLPGTGPYPRWVLNNKKKRYEPFYYFAHKHGKQISWCYLGRFPEKLDNLHMCIECACLGKDDFCEWQGAFIRKKELLTQTFECEGFSQKPTKLSNVG